MPLEFHVSYWTVFGELAPYLAIPIAIVMLVLLLSFASSRSRRSSARSLLLGVLVFLLAFAFLLPLGQSGAGWTYSRGQITVNTGFGSTTFAPYRVNTQWVTHNPGYQLAVRTDGTSTTHFKAGHFTLENGMHANVFEYQLGNKHNPVLALSSHRTLVLLSSPGVTKLKDAIRQSRSKVEPGYVPPHTAHEPLGLWMAVVIAILAMAAQVTMAAHFQRRLPPMMAVHFGLSGNVDRTAPKSRALYIGPVIALSVGAVGVVVALGAPDSITGILFVIPLQLLMVFAMYWMYRVNLGSQTN